MALLTPQRFEIVERLLMALWVGGLCAIGYIAAPVVFASLDNRQIAGMLAGKLFSVISWGGLVIGTVLFLGCIASAGTQWLRQWRAWGLLVMVVIVCVMLFVLQPMMAEIKAQGPVVEGSELAAAFGRLHGISSLLYLVLSLVGLLLVAVGLQKNTTQKSID